VLPTALNIAGTTFIRALTSTLGLPYRAMRLQLWVVAKRDFAGALTQVMNALVNGFASIGTRRFDMRPVPYRVRRAI
jgi:hypothetical protein